MSCSFSIWASEKFALQVTCDRKFVVAPETIDSNLLDLMHLVDVTENVERCSCDGNIN